MRKTKQILSVFLAIMMIFSIMSISAVTANAVVSGTCGDNLTWTLDRAAGTLTIVGTGAMKDFNYTGGPWAGCKYDNGLNVVIKEVIIGDGVTTIGDNAFASHGGLTSVIIPKSVTSIGHSAFFNCNSLSSITIPDSVNIIGNGAFQDCSNLTSINIPDNVGTIGDYAFCNCSSLTHITIPDRVTAIGDYAFCDCTGLTNVTIGESVTSIGNGAFRDCTSLTNVTIGKSVTSIGSAAFYDCKSLTDIIIGENITTIGDDAYWGCSAFSSIIILSKNLTIGNFAFLGNSNLTDVYFIGTEKEWNKISIPSTNASLLKANIHYNYHPHKCNEIVTEPTCTEQGYTTYTCLECTYSYIGNETSATGHTPGEWVVIKPATTTSTGIKAQMCASCSEILVSEDTPVLVARVHDVSMAGASMYYKSSITIAPIINADEGVGYTVTYSSSNPDAVVVDENGNVIAKGTGTAEITVTVTDENGNVVSDTCEINVKYNWWQWIITILLFGWIWY